MTDKVQKIREKVERKLDVMQYQLHRKDAYKELKNILDYIDSLQEEPISEELEDACDSYYDETWDEHGGRAMVIDGCHDIWFPSHATDDFFKAGAEWQKEQMMAKAIDAEILENYDGKVIKYDETIFDEKLSDCKVFDKIKLIMLKED